METTERDGDPSRAVRTGHRGRSGRRAAGTAALVAASLMVAGTVAAGPAQAASSQVYQWGKLSSPKHFRPRLLQNLPSHIVAVQAGNWGGMALDGGGNVWDWGKGNFGEFGNGTKESALDVAVEAQRVTDAVSIGEGDDFAAAVDASGNVWVWGQNLDSDLCIANKRTVLRPVKLTSVSHAVAVQGGGSHILILLANGTVEACGLNAYGELGDGTTKNSTNPVQVTGLSNVVAITAGNEFSSALEADGSVWTWGRNTFGQLGDGTTLNADTPRQVALPGPADQVYDGGDFSYDGHVIVHLDSGAVMAWGNDQWGQLGNGLTARSFSTPQAVNVPAGVTFDTVAAGGRDSFAIDSNGNLWAWGDNAAGDLGIGTKAGSLVTGPKMVGGGFTAISATADEAIGIVGGP